MSAPVNDLFANATAINLNAFAIGTNVGATSESGEPQNNGATVWWTFSVPSSQFVVVSTRWSDAYDTTGGIFSPSFILAKDSNNNPVFTNFASKVQVFTGGPVSNLTEVAYEEYFGGALFGRFDLEYVSSYLNVGYEFADVISFFAQAGITYYIRVDGRTNNPTPTGNILLSVANCCPVCPTGAQFSITGFLAGSPTPIATATIASGQLSMDFGNVPRGQYLIVWQSGYMICEHSCCIPPVDICGDIVTTFPGSLGINGCPPCNSISSECSEGQNDGTAGGTVVAAAEANPPWTLINWDGGDLSLASTGYVGSIENGACLSNCAGVTFQPCTGGPITYALYLYPGEHATPCSGATIINAIPTDCSGNQNVIEVFLNNPNEGVNECYLKMTSVVGMTVLTPQITLAPIPGKSSAYFYIEPIPLGGNASAVIELVDVATNTVCSSYNFNAAVQGVLTANGTNILSSANGQFTGTFGIELASNYGCASIGNATATLAATGGIVSPSAPVTGLAFTAGQTTQIPFTFQTTGGESVTASITIAAGTTQYATITFELSANLAVSSLNPIEPAVNCLGVQGCRFILSFVNNGLLPTFNAEWTVYNFCGQANATTQMGIVNPGQTVTFNNPPLSLSDGGFQTITIQQTDQNNNTTSFPSYNARVNC